jgi:hypothetical protein
MLKNQTAKGTFFVAQDNLKTDEAKRILKRIVAEGHNVGLRFSRSIVAPSRGVDGLTDMLKSHRDEVEAIIGSKVLYVRL